ncbi:hypothetical protein P7C70_g6538, partial [Phenoliferia sp. Uapishka_3]
MSAALEFLWTHITGKTHLPTASLEGSVIIVTGANRGLGIETALHLARLNPAKLILAVRDLATGEKASARIEASTEFKGEIDIWTLDLASFESVKSFALKVNALERLVSPDPPPRSFLAGADLVLLISIVFIKQDILVENAGIMSTTFKKTSDNWERTLQVNGLSTGLLGLLSLPALRRTVALPPPFPGSTIKPHLTIVGSEVHAWAAFKESKVPGSTLEALNSEEHANIHDRYNVTKLISLFMARKIAALPASEGVVVNCINPGLCKSDFRADLPTPVAWLMNKIAWSAEAGSMNIVWGAVEAPTSGAYISTCSEIAPSAFSTSEEGIALENKLWSEMSEVWQKVAPSVVEVLGPNGS